MSIYDQVRFRGDDIDQQVAREIEDITWRLEQLERSPVRRAVDWLLDAYAIARDVVRS